MKRNLLQLHEVAEKLNISQANVRALVFKRKIPFLKIGRLIRFDEEDIQNWLEGKRVKAN